MSSVLAEAAVATKGDPPLKRARIGQGTLIDEDVRLGAEPGRAHTRPVEIGRDGHRVTPFLRRRRTPEEAACLAASELEPSAAAIWA